MKLIKEINGLYGITYQIFQLRDKWGYQNKESGIGLLKDSEADLYDFLIETGKISPINMIGTETDYNNHE